MATYAVVVVGLVEAETSEEVPQAAHVSFCQKGGGQWSYYPLALMEEPEI